MFGFLAPLWAKIVVGIVAAFIVIQLIPVWLLQNNPPVVQEPQWDSPQTRALAQRACFDCHSNETQWPIYDRIAPVSWYAVLDTVRGRRHLNFSEWNANGGGFEGEGEGGRGSGRQIARVIEDGSMPPWQYTLLHPQANLTPAEKQQLIQGLQNTLNK